MNLNYNILKRKKYPVKFVIIIFALVIVLNFELSIFSILKCIFIFLNVHKSSLFVCFFFYVNLIMH